MAHELSPQEFDGWAAAFPESELARITAHLVAQKTLTVEALKTGNALSDAALEIVCRYCKTPNPIVWHTQSRSGDEGMTVNYMCTNTQCGRFWRE